MKQFFKKYTQAFDSLNAVAIADLYTVPCSASDVDGANVYVDRESLINKLNKNCSSMKSMGYRHSNFNILEELEMGDTARAVNIAWRVSTTNEDIEFRSLYVCHKIDNQWFIFSANVYQGEFTDAI